MKKVKNRLIIILICVFACVNSNNSLATLKSYDNEIISNSNNVNLQYTSQASGMCGSDINWSLDSEGTLTIIGTGSMWNWDSYEDRPWHDWRNDIHGIVINNGVENIGRLAFDGCEYLVNVQLPDTITSIGYRSFADCYSIMTMTIPDNVAIIDYEAFRGCSSLLDVVIPSTVTEIGTRAFSGCGSLADVFFGGNEDDLWEYGLGSDNSDLINSTIHYCTAYEYMDYKNNQHGGVCGRGLTWTLDKNGRLTIDGNGIMWNWRSYDDRPWHDSRNNIHEIVVNHGVKNIGRLAFDGCEYLVNVQLPESITSIGYRSFADCYSIMTMTIPDNVAIIDYEAFRGCSSLLDVVIPSNVTEIGTRAFSGCGSLADVFFGGNEDDWWEYGLGSDNSDLINSTIHYCTAYEYMDYKNNQHGGVCGRGLTWTLDKNGILTIDGKGIMWNWRSYDDIPWYDSRSQITELIINNGVENIGQLAFDGCEKLKKCELPTSVSCIGYAAFDECYSLDEIHYAGTSSQWSFVKLSDKNDNLSEDKFHYDSAPSLLPISFQIVDLTLSDISEDHQLSAIPSGDFLASVTLKKIREAGNAYLVLTTYSSLGQFQGLLYVKVEDMPVGATIELTIPVRNDNKDIAQVKAFFISSFTDFRPLANYISFPT